MTTKKRRYRPKPPPRAMVSIFASLGRAWVVRILCSCLGLILLGMALALLVFGHVPEPEPIPRKGFEAGEVVLMFLGWFGISSLAFVGWQVAMHEAHAWGKKPIRVLWNAALVLLNVLVIVLVVDVFGLQLSGQDWHVLGFRPMSWRWVLASVGLGLVSMVLSGGVAALAMRLLDRDWVNKQEQFILPTEQSTVSLDLPTNPEKASLSILGAVAMVSLVGVAVPIVEEILFRGVLYAWLSEHLPWMLAVLLSSIVFGLAHFESGRPVVAACCVSGVFMAVAFHYSHSLFAPIIIHAVNNVTKVVLTYLLRD